MSKTPINDFAVCLDCVDTLIRLTSQSNILLYSNILNASRDAHAFYFQHEKMIFYTCSGVKGEK